MSFTRGSDITRVDDAASSTTIATAAYNQAAGELIVVAIKWESNNTAPSSVADTAGNTYVLRQHTSDGTNLQNSAIYDNLGGSKLGNASNVITVTWAAAKSFKSLSANRYTFTGTPEFTDIPTTGLSGTTDIISSGIFSQGGLSVCTVSNFGGFTGTQGTGWTEQDDSGATTGFYFEDQLNTSPVGTITADVTLASSAAYTLAAASYVDSVTTDPRVVQAKNNENAASATTIASGTLDSNVTSGNLLLIAVSQGAATTVTVTKNSGTATIGTVTEQGSVTEAGTGVETTHLTCSVTGTGTLDLLATFGAAQTNRTISVYEIAKVASVQGQATGTDAGSNPTTSFNYNVTAQPVHVFAVGTDVQGGNLRAGATLTGLQSLGGVAVYFVRLSYKKVVATGNTPITFANAGLDRSNMTAIALVGAPAIASVLPNKFYNAQTNIVVSGANFGASQGAGKVWISPSDNVSDGARVEQTVTAWADTSITITAVRGSLGMETTLYLFVVENGGTSNTPGSPVKFMASASIAWIVR